MHSLGGIRLCQAMKRLLATVAQQRVEWNSPMLRRYAWYFAEALSQGACRAAVGSTVASECVAGGSLCRLAGSAVGSKLNNLV